MLSKKQILLFFSVLFFLNTHLVFSQEGLDKTQLFDLLSKHQPDSTLADIYNELCWPIYADENLDSAKFYGKKAVVLANKIKDYKRECVAHRRLGIAYTNSSMYKEAINEQNISLQIAKAINFKRGEQLALNNIGVAYLDNEIYNKALNYFLQAIKIAETENDYSNASKLYANCGIIYKEIKNYSYAKRAYKKSIHFSKIQHDSINIALSNIKLSTIYRELTVQDSANYFSNQALLYIRGSADKQLFTSFYINKGSIYFQNQDFDSAIYSYRKAILPITKANDLVIIHANLGLMFKKLNQTDSSAKYFQLAYESSVKNRFVNSIISLTEEMALIQFKKKNLANYHLYISSYLKYLDTAIIESNAAQLARQQLEFDFEKQEIENKIIIDQKNSEIKINNILLEAREKQNYYFLFGLGLLGFIGFLLFIQSRNRKKTNEKLRILNYELDQANKIKARFFSILNHDLRAPISSLIHFLHLQKNHPELLDTESKTRLENKTISATENLLISMEDMLIWSKGQMEHFKPKYVPVSVKGLFKDIENHFLSTENVSIVFENKEDIELFTDIDYLKTIMRNLTSNAVKALSKSRDAKIIWKAWKNTNQTYLSITDNGSGGNQDKFKALYDDTEIVGIKTGLGLHLIRDLAKAIDCEITLDSKINHGTTFILKINPPN